MTIDVLKNKYVFVVFYVNRIPGIGMTVIHSRLLKCTGFEVALFLLGAE